MLQAPWATQELGLRNKSLPLNRRRRLRAHVIRDSVNPAHFVDDSAGYFFEQGIGQLRPIRSHEIAGLHGAERDDVVVGAAIAHHADALDGEENCEGLGCGFVPVFLARSALREAQGERVRRKQRNSSMNMAPALRSRSAYFF